MRTLPAASGTVSRVDAVRLWLVDDHVLLTEALAGRLAAFADLAVAGWCASDDPRLAAGLARELPDVIVVEPERARLSEDRLFALIQDAAPDARIVVLTAGREPERALAAARAGAQAWVPKAAGTTHLVEVLRGVRRGDAWFPPRCLGVVLRGLRADAHRARPEGGPLAALSGREREVLGCLVDGMRGPEIAAALGLSTNTIRAHTHSVYAKLGVHSRLQAVKAARAAGLSPRTPADLPL
ncbi:helix-turn-helix transcriptional regulator [Actinokineospora enzanensis]|uniref:helix-turn-helix transcriptional regulator n=1 Tax=Actinokineospora enzanensis TaxID=155975 RepID=UPI00038238DD|nr:response regulator transcription factor [Actinokineospora enzanensis]